MAHGVIAAPLVAAARGIAELGSDLGGGHVSKSAVSLVVCER